MRAPLDLIKGDSIGSETDYRDALPVNMVGIVRPMFGVSGYMIQIPGLVQYGTSTGVSRGAVWNERFNELYRVDGNSLVQVESNGTVTTLGTITGTGLVSLPYSFNTQGVVADGRFWLYDATSGFREITDPDLGDPIDCVWIDGYYFFTDGDFIYHTEISDEESIDPLQFATAEFMPDKSLGVAKTQDNKVIVFGRYTVEYFVNVASDNFAFQRVQTRAQKIGIVGTYCKTEMNNRLYIIVGRKDESVSVYSLGVGDSQKVATREIEKIINEYSEEILSQQFVESYEEDGYDYLIVRLPNETLVFNETLARQGGIDQAWSIFKTGTGSAPWRAQHLVFDVRRSEWVCGDREDARLGYLDNFISTQYGELPEWELYTPFIYLDSASIDRMEIETMPGHSGDDDATVFLSLTYNGVTYGKEWTKLYGEPSNYGQRFICRRLGYVRDWVGFKMRGVSRSRMAFGRAFIDYG